MATPRPQRTINRWRAGPLTLPAPALSRPRAWGRLAAAPSGPPLRKGAGGGAVADRDSPPAGRRPVRVAAWDGRDTRSAALDVAASAAVGVGRGRQGRGLGGGVAPRGSRAGARQRRSRHAGVRRHALTPPFPGRLRLAARHRDTRRRASVGTRLGGKRRASGRHTSVLPLPSCAGVAAVAEARVHKPRPRRRAATALATAGSRRPRRAYPAEAHHHRGRHHRHRRSPGPGHPLSHPLHPLCFPFYVSVFSSGCDRPPWRRRRRFCCRPTRCRHAGVPCVRRRCGRW